MGQIEVRSKATGKIRLMTERNLVANEGKFERVVKGNIEEVPRQYTSEDQSGKKKAARGAGENKTKNKEENAEDSKSPE